MKESFYDIIRGKFLVSEAALKSWRFILFLSILALIMIGSSHSADRKVYKISKLNLEVKEMKSEYVDMRVKLMHSRMESRLIASMEGYGLQPPTTRPKRIRITNKTEGVEQELEETALDHNEEPLSKQEQQMAVEGKIIM